MNRRQHLTKEQLEIVSNPETNVFVNLNHYSGEKLFTLNLKYPKRPLRSRLAWRLRDLADWIDGDSSYGITFICHDAITGKDAWDALYFGVSSMVKFLQDLLQDRMIK